VSCMRFCARFATTLIYLYIGSLRDFGTVPAQENSSSIFVVGSTPRARGDDMIFFAKRKGIGMNS
jgi:hypothetical protein